MSGLPPCALGDAVGVLIFTFICLLSALLLIWLLWVHKERFGYVALIAYFAALCAISSIIQQIYHYTKYEELAWGQLDYIKANYPSAEVIFKNGNFGFVLYLSNIQGMVKRNMTVSADVEKGFFCYIIESTYLFTYTLHITLSIYGIWVSHRRAERIYAILSKICPVILSGISIGLEYTPAVQRSWIAYNFVANTQAVLACTLSIVLIAIILWKYVDSKRIWKNIRTGPMVDGSSVSWKSYVLKSWKRKNSSATSSETPRVQDYVPKSLLDSNWLVVRLSIAVVFISGFIFATVLTHLPSPNQMAHKVMTDAPDLTPASARSEIVGYIYGVAVGLAILIVFGLTRPFRQTMYKTFVPKSWRRENRRQEEWTSDPRVCTPALAVQGPETSPGTCDNHRITPRQDWIMRANMRLPTGSAGHSYELNVGMSRHENSGKRPASSLSKASLDSLLRASP